MVSNNNNICFEELSSIICFIWVVLAPLVTTTGELQLYVYY